MSIPATKAIFETPPPVAVSGARPRIMLIDDCDDTRGVIKLILESEYDVLDCNNGLSAWEQIEQGTDVKAIVTDINMPGLDGIELTDRVRKSDNPQIKDIPVIVITGAADQDVRRRAFVVGATGFILKPVDTTQLKALLSAYVRLNNTQRELRQTSAALEEQSIVDALTGLRSRRYFMDRGEQDVAFSTRREKDLAVIRVDVDRFAEIAASHGKERVNALLKWLGKLLLINARVEDTVARLGDAEFSILAIDTDSDAAMVICDRLRDTVATNPFTDGNVTIPITFRIGVAELAKDGAPSMDALLALAQERLARQPRQTDQPQTDIPTTNEAPNGATPNAVDVSAPVENAAPPPPKSAIVDPIETLSVEELEQLIRQETTLISPANTTSGKTDVPLELVSIEAALKLLSQGNGDALDPYLDPLIKRIQPLLDYYQLLDKKK